MAFVGPESEVAGFVGPDDEIPNSGKGSSFLPPSKGIFGDVLGRLPMGQFPDVQDPAFAAKHIASIGAGMVVPELVGPALGIGGAASEGAGLATRTIKAAKDLAASGAISGASAKTAERVVGELSGEHESLPQTAKEIGTDTLGGAVVGPAIGAVGSGLVGGYRLASKIPYLGGFLKGAIPAAKEALTPGPDYLGRIGAGYFRRVSNPAQEGLSTARNAIESITGEKVPVSIGEAIGDPAIAHKIGVEDAVLGKDDFEALKRATLFTAAELKGIEVTPSQLADQTVGVLRKEFGSISAPAREAIAKASAELHPAIDTATKEVEEAVKKVVPGTSATAEMTGQRLQNTIRKAHQELENEEEAAWNITKSDPDYDKVKVNLNNSKAWAKDVKEGTLQTDKIEPNPFAPKFIEPEQPLEPGQTRAIPGAMSTGVNPLVDQITAAAKTGSLRQIRGFRTKVRDSIGNDSIFPGTSDYEKGALADALTEDINQSIDALPSSDLKDKLLHSNALTRQKYERFQGKPVEQFLAEFGGEGGPSAEALANRVSGTGGHELIGALENASGNRSPEIRSAIQGYLFNNAAEAGRDIKTGSVSAGKILSNIEGLSPELRKEFFPELEKVRALALRESKISSLESSAPNILKTLRIDDPSLLMDALGSSANKSVTARIQDAFRKSADLEAELNNSILGALKSDDAAGLASQIAKNPEHFVDGILNKNFGAKQVQKMVDLIAREDQTILRKLQFRYVSELLEKYGSTKSPIDTTKFARDLSKGAEFLGIGNNRETAKAILGTQKTDNVESVLKALSTFDKARGYVDPNTPLSEATAQLGGEALGAAGLLPNTGAVGGGTLVSRMGRYLQKIRYNIAAEILTNPELRQLARTPVSRITPEQWQSIFRATANSIIGIKISEDSPEAESLKRLSQ